NALDNSYTYWLATVSEDGRPEARVVWGLWEDGRLVLTVGSSTINRNVRANPNVTVHLPSGSEVVIVEGTAAVETDRDLLARYIERYNPKYGWNFEGADVGGAISVSPRSVLAWLSTPLDSRQGAP